jgi:predicted RNase H-like HicB family nuclease
MRNHYSMVIQWSDEDEAFIVRLPEFGPYASTHGVTREKAVRMGCDALECLIEAYEAEGKRLPSPRKFAAGPAKTRKRKVRAS